MMEKIGFVKQLASCEKKTRDRAVRLLESWLTAKATQVSDDELKKMWKGLFYCVWHADKRHIQADVIEKLASLIRTLDLPLAIHYLQGTFFALDTFPARGVNLHFVDVYLNEIAEYLPLSQSAFAMVFEPLYGVLARVSDRVLVERVRSNVFERLVEKGNELLKRRKDEDAENEDDDENVEKLGCVALTMGIGKRLLELAAEESSLQPNRKVLYALYEEFGKLEKLYLASGVDVLFKRVKRRRVSPESEEVRDFLKDEPGSHGNHHIENKMELDEEDRSIVKKVKQKKVKKLPQADDKMEIVDECTGVEMKKVKKGKRKKVKQAADHNDAIVIVEGGAMATGNGVKLKKNKVKKVKKEANSHTVEEGMESSVGMLSKKKKLKTSSGLCDKNLKERMSVVDEAATDDGVHEEQTVDFQDMNRGATFNFEDSVISNLQKEFEKVAAELGENMDGFSSPDATLTAPISPGSKKRKRVKSASKEVSGNSSLGQSNGGSTAVPVGPNGIGSCGKSVEKTAKKVRFSMKRNLVWKPTSPLPPESLRMPPSATPRGSALKKGVPPGPIRIIKESPSPQRRILLSISARKGRKKLKSISLGTKLARKRQSKVWRINSVCWQNIKLFLVDVSYPWLTFQLHISNE
ncbi:hypothetical protein SUGI_0837200 [Cryptomeria japonica]|nr:hypothetical protein SUGI_0837200 [Cryptomeria japonica]